MSVSAHLLGLKASASGYPVVRKHVDKAEREHVAKAIFPETMIVGGDTACYLHWHSRCTGIGRKGVLVREFGTDCHNSLRTGQTATNEAATLNEPNQ